MPGPAFNWVEIKKCAALGLPAGIKPSAPGGSNVLSGEWRDYEAKFRSVMLCRDMLMARHDGFVEADGKVENDPIGTEPMMRSDDFN